MIYLVVFILILLYTIFAIYKESEQTPLKAEIVHGYCLDVPTWWTKSENNFIRLDSHYDWFATLKKLPDTYSSHYDFFIQENIEFDQMEYSEKKDGEKIFIQGTATKNKEKRIFWEGVFFNDIVYYSQSSILSGGIEGPFFEKSIHTLKKLN